MAFKSNDTPSETMQTLNEGKKHLREGNFFSSIVALRDALKAFINMITIPKKEKAILAKAINDFQLDLSTSQEFNDLYGKVYFRESDFATSHDFICQLIEIKESEIADVLIAVDAIEFLKLNSLSKEDQKTAKRMVSLVERGETSALRELVAVHDGLGSLVLSFYNETGIGHRESGNFDQAIIRYKKALSVSPNDENIFYNIARAYMENGQKKNAEVTIGQAMLLNPQFQEGARLEKYIKRWSP